ncbi:MAG: nucleotidyltransferase domain-containing protein [Candidatus Hodarchaeales archaeon]|jgi:predicted nucleotidyltransferase
MSRTYYNFSNYQTGLKVTGIKKKYINSIVELIETKYSGSIVALGIFGSVARGTADEFSDVDLIIIYSDTLPKLIKEEMTKKFIGLERAYSYQSKQKSFKNSFLRSILHLTGMFRSIFITSESQWNEKHFKKMFNVGSLINKFAPKNLVLLSLLNDIVWIVPDISFSQFSKKNELNYKEEIKSIFKMASYWVEWVRGYLTAQLLSLGAFFITPLFDESTKFSIEAVKWSKLSCNMLIKLRITYKDEEIFYKVYKDKDYFGNKHIENFFAIKPYNSLRANYRRDPKINFLAMLHVLKIFHLIRK